MGFQVSYIAGGELDKVKKINSVEFIEDGRLDEVDLLHDVEKVAYLEKIKNFAQLAQPYNKMVMMNVPAIDGVYDLDYTSPDENVELISIVVTCSGYGENDYYNLYVDDELWFDTWFPTEVKEGLYIGTSTYVYELPASSKIKLKFVNISGTAKKVWLGIRMLKNSTKIENMDVEILDTSKISEPVSPITNIEMEPILNSQSFN